MRHTKGYMAIVRTSKIKNGSICKTETILDNKVWKCFDSVCNRIRSIAKNKCDKHNYKLNHDHLSFDFNKRLGKSDIDLVISRDKYNVIKSYIVKPMQIEY